MYFFAVVLPPLAILMAGKPFQFLISIPLTIFFWIPGIIYAIMIVNEYKADQRNQQLVNAMSQNQK